MLADEARCHLGGESNDRLNEMLANFGDHDTLR